MGCNSFRLRSYSDERSTILHRRQSPGFSSPESRDHVRTSRSWFSLFRRRKSTENKVVQQSSFAEKIPEDDSWLSIFKKKVSKEEPQPSSCHKEEMQLRNEEECKEIEDEQVPEEQKPTFKDEGQVRKEEEQIAKEKAPVTEDLKQDVITHTEKSRNAIHCESSPETQLKTSQVQSLVPQIIAKNDKENSQKSFPHAFETLRGKTRQISPKTDKFIDVPSSRTSINMRLPYEEFKIPVLPKPPPTVLAESLQPSKLSPFISGDRFSEGATFHNSRLQKATSLEAISPIDAIKFNNFQRDGNKLSLNKVTLDLELSKLSINSYMPTINKQALSKDSKKLVKTKIPIYSSKLKPKQVNQIVVKQPSSKKPSTQYNYVFNKSIYKPPVLTDDTASLKTRFRMTNMAEIKSKSHSESIKGKLKPPKVSEISPQESKLSLKLDSKIGQGIPNTKNIHKNKHVKEKTPLPTQEKAIKKHEKSYIVTARKFALTQDKPHKYSTAEEDVIQTKSKNRTPVQSSKKVTYSKINFPSRSNIDKKNENNEESTLNSSKEVKSIQLLSTVSSTKQTGIDKSMGKSLLPKPEAKSDNKKKIKESWQKIKIGNIKALEPDEESFLTAWRENYSHIGLPRNAGTTKNKEYLSLSSKEHEVSNEHMLPSKIKPFIRSNIARQNWYTTSPKDLLYVRKKIKQSLKKISKSKEQDDSYKEPWFIECQKNYVDIEGKRTQFKKNTPQLRQRISTAESDMKKELYDSNNGDLMMECMISPSTYAKILGYGTRNVLESRIRDGPEYKKEQFSTFSISAPNTNKEYITKEFDNSKGSVECGLSGINTSRILNMNENRNEIKKENYSKMSTEMNFQKPDTHDVFYDVHSLPISHPLLKEKAMIENMCQNSLNLYDSSNPDLNFIKQKSASAINSEQDDQENCPISSLQNSQHKNDMADTLLQSPDPIQETYITVPSSNVIPYNLMNSKMTEKHIPFSFEKSYSQLSGMEPNEGKKVKQVNLNNDQIERIPSTLPKPCMTNTCFTNTKYHPIQAVKQTFSSFVGNGSSYTNGEFTSKSRNAKTERLIGKSPTKANIRQKSGSKVKKTIVSNTNPLTGFEVPHKSDCTWKAKIHSLCDKSISNKSAQAEPHESSISPSIECRKFQKATAHQATKQVKPYNIERTKLVDHKIQSKLFKDAQCRNKERCKNEFCQSMIGIEPTEIKRGYSNSPVKCSSQNVLALQNIPLKWSRSYSFFKSKPINSFDDSSRIPSCNNRCLNHSYSSKEDAGLFKYAKTDENKYAQSKEESFAKLPVKCSAASSLGKQTNLVQRSHSYANFNKAYSSAHEYDSRCQYPRHASSYSFIDPLNPKNKSQIQCAHAKDTSTGPPSTNPNCKKKKQEVKVEGKKKVCDKVNIPECKPVYTTDCVSIIKVLPPCSKRLAPKPSYSECLREKTPPRPFTECRLKKEDVCPDKIRKSKFYDGCHPKEKEVFVCPDSEKDKQKTKQKKVKRKKKEEHDECEENDECDDVESFKFKSSYSKSPMKCSSTNIPQHNLYPIRSYSNLKLEISNKITLPIKALSFTNCEVNHHLKMKSYSKTKPTSKKSRYDTILCTEDNDPPYRPMEKGQGQTGPSKCGVTIISAKNFTEHKELQKQKIFKCEQPKTMIKVERKVEVKEPPPRKKEIACDGPYRPRMESCIRQMEVQGLKVTKNKCGVDTVDPACPEKKEDERWKDEKMERSQHSTGGSTSIGFPPFSSGSTMKYSTSKSVETRELTKKYYIPEYLSNKNVLTVTNFSPIKTGMSEDISTKTSVTTQLSLNNSEPMDSLKKNYGPLFFHMNNGTTTDVSISKDDSDLFKKSPDPKAASTLEQRFTSKTKCDSYKCISTNPSSSSQTAKTTPKKLEEVEKIHILSLRPSDKSYNTEPGYNSNSIKMKKETNVEDIVTRNVEHTLNKLEDKESIKNLGFRANEKSCNDETSFFSDSNRLEEKTCLKNCSTGNIESLDTFEEKANVKNTSKGSYNKYSSTLEPKKADKKVFSSINDKDSPLGSEIMESFKNTQCRISMQSSKEDWCFKSGSMKVECNDSMNVIEPLQRLEKENSKNCSFRTLEAPLKKEQCYKSESEKLKENNGVKNESTRNNNEIPEMLENKENVRNFSRINTECSWKQETSINNISQKLEQEKCIKNCFSMVNNSSYKQDICNKVATSNADSAVEDLITTIKSWFSILKAKQEFVETENKKEENELKNSVFKISKSTKKDNSYKNSDLFQTEVSENKECKIEKHEYCSANRNEKTEKNRSGTSALEAQIIGNYCSESSNKDKCSRVTIQGKTECNNRKDSAKPSERYQCCEIKSEYERGEYSKDNIKLIKNNMKTLSSKRYRKQSTAAHPINKAGTQNITPSACERYFNQYKRNVKSSNPTLGKELNYASKIPLRKQQPKLANHLGKTKKRNCAVTVPSPTFMPASRKIKSEKSLVDENAFSDKPNILLDNVQIQKNNVLMDYEKQVDVDEAVKNKNCQLANNISKDTLKNSGALEATEVHAPCDLRKDEENVALMKVSEENKKGLHISTDVTPQKIRTVNTQSVSDNSGECRTEQNEDSTISQFSDTVKSVSSMPNVLENKNATVLKTSQETLYFTGLVTKELGCKINNKSFVSYTVVSTEPNVTISSSKSLKTSMKRIPLVRTAKANKLTPSKISKRKCKHIMRPAILNTTKSPAGVSSDETNVIRPLLISEVLDKREKNQNHESEQLTSENGYLALLKKFPAMVGSAFGYSYFTDILSYSQKNLPCQSSNLINHVHCQKSQTRVLSRVDSTLNADLTEQYQEKEAEKDYLADSSIKNAGFQRALTYLEYLTQASRFDLKNSDHIYGLHISELTFSQVQFMLSSRMSPIHIFLKYKVWLFSIPGREIPYNLDHILNQYLSYYRKIPPKYSCPKYIIINSAINKMNYSESYLNICKTPPLINLNFSMFNMPHTNYRMKKLLTVPYMTNIIPRYKSTDNSFCDSILNMFKKVKIGEEKNKKNDECKKETNDKKKDECQNEKKTEETCETKKEKHYTECKEPPKRDAHKCDEKDKKNTASPTDKSHTSQKQECKTESAKIEQESRNKDCQTENIAKKNAQKTHDSKKNECKQENSAQKNAQKSQESKKNECKEQKSAKENAKKAPESKKNKCKGEKSGSEKNEEEKKEEEVCKPVKRKIKKPKMDQRFFMICGLEPCIKEDEMLPPRSPPPDELKIKQDGTPTIELTKEIESTKVKDYCASSPKTDIEKNESYLQQKREKVDDYCASSPKTIDKSHTGTTEKVESIKEGPQGSKINEKQDLRKKDDTSSPPVCKEENSKQKVETLSKKDEQIQDKSINKNEKQLSKEKIEVQHPSSRKKEESKMKPAVPKEDDSHHKNKKEQFRDKETMNKVEKPDKTPPKEMSGKNEYKCTPIPDTPPKSSDMTKKKDSKEKASVKAKKDDSKEKAKGNEEFCYMLMSKSELEKQKQDDKKKEDPSSLKSEECVKNESVAKQSKEAEKKNDECDRDAPQTINKEKGTESSTQNTISARQPFKTGLVTIPDTPDCICIKSETEKIAKDKPQTGKKKSEQNKQAEANDIDSKESVISKKESKEKGKEEGKNVIEPKTKPTKEEVEERKKAFKVTQLSPVKNPPPPPPCDGESETPICASDTDSPKDTDCVIGLTETTCDEPPPICIKPPPTSATSPPDSQETVCPGLTICPWSPEPQERTTIGPQVPQEPEPESGQPQPPKPPVGTETPESIVCPPGTDQPTKPPVSPPGTDQPQSQKPQIGPEELLAIACRPRTDQPQPTKPPPRETKPPSKPKVDNSSDILKGESSTAKPPPSTTTIKPESSICPPEKRVISKNKKGAKEPTSNNRPKQANGDKKENKSSKNNKNALGNSKSTILCPSLHRHKDILKASEPVTLNKYTFIHNGILDLNTIEDYYYYYGDIRKIEKSFSLNKEEIGTSNSPLKNNTENIPNCNVTKLDELYSQKEEICNVTNANRVNNYNKQVFYKQCCADKDSVLLKCKDMKDVGSHKQNILKMQKEIYDNRIENSNQCGDDNINEIESCDHLCPPKKILQNNMPQETEEDICTLCPPRRELKSMKTKQDDLMERKRNFPVTQLSPVKNPPPPPSCDKLYGDLNETASNQKEEMSNCKNTEK